RLGYRGAGKMSGIRFTQAEVEVHMAQFQGKKARTEVCIAEKPFMAAVIKIAKLRGWMLYHTHDSRRSTSGFPDLVLVRPPRLIFAELKSQSGKPSMAQVEWLDALSGCGFEVHLWRPSDLERVAWILR